MAERRRRRIVAGDGEPSGERAPSVGPAARSRAGDEPASWGAAEVDPIGAERGLRGLVGGGSSQVSPAAALRARDAARPTPADLARAEAELHIIRRHWTPRD